MWNQLDLLLDRDVQEAEREFYGLIGLVCVRFARLDAQLIELLRALIHPDDALLTGYLTQDTPVARTIDLIQKIGRTRPVDDDLLSDLISKANNLKGIRNEYIHGVWDIQVKENGQIEARCKRRRKILFESNGSIKHWMHGGFQSRTITLDRLASTAKKLEELLQIVENLIADIEEDPDFWI